jgi:16S rRNA G966 N2-methylase RsmD
MLSAFFDVESSCYDLGKVDEKNKLYFGDNLRILRDYVATDSVDLLYLDPPFNSSATYNVLFKEKSGEESAAQIMAFEVSVAALYERRRRSQTDATAATRIRGRVQGNRHQRPAQARRPDAGATCFSGPQRHDGHSALCGVLAGTSHVGSL